MGKFSANDVARSSNHKTISAPDVFKALEIVELDNLSPQLRESLTGKTSARVSCPF
jgi:hypothetical protein